MADFNALQAIINAYIKRNGVQAITGQILNGVLTGMVNALGKGYTVAGAASPTTDPGTMTGPLAYIAYTAGTYTHFDNIVVEQGEVSMLIYNEAEWHKEVLFSLAAQATVDDNIGVPSVGVSFVDGILTFNFRNMKGEPGENGQDGDPAGFGTISASISGGVGTPGVSVQSSGPDTAKNIAFQFTNLKGETGVTSCVVTVDNTTGNPSCAVSLVGQELHLDFSGLKGAQGNTGSSMDYPFTIVNNLTTDDPTQALSAAMGVQLESEVSQLEAKVTDLMAVEILNGTYETAENLKYVPCPFKQGKEYVVDFSWEYTSGGLAYLVVRQGSGPLVTITPNYYTSRGNDKVYFKAEGDYNNLIIINYGGATASGNVTLSVKESYVSEDIKADIDTINGNIGTINDEISDLQTEKFSIDRLEGVAKGAVNNAANNLGYVVEKDNQGTYGNLESKYFIAPIPAGSVITNNGIKVALASDNALTNRHDIQPGETWTATAEINVIRSLEVSGNVRLVIDTKNALLNGIPIDGSKITEDSVEINRLSFVETGTNIYDQAHDSGFENGYLRAWGEVTPNASYNTSGLIKVEPNTTYGYIAGLALRFSMEYDEYKNPITSTYTDSPTTITTSANARYIRVTFYAGENRYFLCKGEPKPYEDYKIFIPSEYLQTDAPGSELPFFLPKHIYVANGRTIEIYYNQVLLNADRYNIQATCPIGKALERKFQIIGDTSHVGNTYTLSLVAYNDAGEVVASGTSTIHIVSNTISASKNVLPVGDSLTNGKPWLSELHTLSANLNTVGTRQGIHEGRSGAAVSTYTNVSGGIVYDYDNQYSDSTVPVFDASASYGIGDKVKIAHTFGNGTSGYRYWVFKQAHSPGAFVESEAYCYSGGNPFYDYVNDKISFSFYRSFFGINYDAIILYLGTNGINLEPETNPNGALGIKNLIEYIREDEPTTPILVINTIFRSNQNGIGNQGNTDGYVAQSAYKFNEDKKVLLLAKAVDDLCGSMSNVYLCPVGFTHDSKYNFGNNKVQVNPRLSSTEDVFELQPSDSVHPQTPGYMQMADEMFSTLCAVFGS